jgi:hypothetical protein
MFPITLGNRLNRLVHGATAVVKETFVLSQDFAFNSIPSQRTLVLLISSQLLFTQSRYTESGCLGKRFLISTMYMSQPAPFSKFFKFFLGVFYAQKGEE